MGQELKIDVTDARKSFRIFELIVLLLILLSVPLSIARGYGDAILAIVLMLVLWSITATWFEWEWRRRLKPRWFLTKEGLRVLHPAGPTDIPWAAIVEMARFPYGLRIRWSEPVLHGKGGQERIRRAYVYVSADQAESVLSEWKGTSRGQHGSKGSSSL
jgi:hypothetical protein